MSMMKEFAINKEAKATAKIAGAVVVGAVGLTLMAYGGSLTMRSAKKVKASAEGIINEVKAIFADDEVVPVELEAGEVQITEF